MIEVWNEWDHLQEIIVGRIESARVPTPGKDLLSIEFKNCKSEDVPTGEYKRRVIDETIEDLDILSSTLSDLGITVKRPELIDHSKNFGNPHWSTDGLYCYCPRDVFLAIGNTIIETPMALRSRYFETFAYKQIMLEYFNHGTKWVSAPKAELTDNSYGEPDNVGVILMNNEPIFDAANVLRLGDDLLYLVSNTGNELGCRWLQNFLGNKFRVHPCFNLYAYSHIDTTISPLREGLVLLNPDRVKENNLPAVLKNWKILWADEIVDTGYVSKYPRSSKWIGMNLLMINPNLAIVDKNQIPLIKKLEKEKIDVIPLQLRHDRVLGGGFHCVTLDTKRVKK